MLTYECSEHPTTYGAVSTARLESCAEPLQRILHALAADGWDISVLCGHRMKHAQDRAYFEYKSACVWPDSDHNEIPSQAMDIGPWIPGFGVPYDVEAPWIVLAGAVLTKADELGIALEWGGFYSGLKDLGHFSLKTK